MDRIRIIEFLGMPNAGLSTYVDKTKAEIENSRGLKVDIFEGGRRKTPFDESMGIAGFNIKSAEDMITKVMEHQEGVLLLSRGLWDNAAFLLAARQTGEITTKQYQETIKYFDTFDSFTKAAVLIGLPVCDSLGNYHEKCYCDETPKIYSEINNPKFLRCLAKAYITTYFGMIASIDPNNVLFLSGNEKFNKNICHITCFINRILE